MDHDARSTTTVIFIIIKILTTDRNKLYSVFTKTVLQCQTV